MTASFKIGIIGGSGLEDPQFFKDAKLIELDTPYGKPSDAYLEGVIEGVNVVLLARHGRKHDIMPGNVNYRANLWGMHMLGVKVIIASTACGSLQEHIKPGELVFPDSVFDRTTGRKATFFDGEHNEFCPGVCHLQMDPLYNQKLRLMLAKAAETLKLSYHDGGFGVCIEGPRFSSKAESRVFRSWGAALVNMTLMPECVLAKELGIPYATTSLVTDYDCWRDELEQVSMEMVMATFKQNVDKCKTLFLAVVPQIAQMDWSNEIRQLKSTARHSVMVGPEVVIPHLQIE